MKPRTTKPLFSFLLALSLVAAPALGHSPSEDRAWFPDLPAYLELTEGQIEELQALREQLHEAIRPVAEAMREKHRRLQEELASDSPQPDTLGELLLGIRADQRAIREIQVDQRQDSVAVLAPEQQTKLRRLRVALILQVAARQAVALNLISDPADESAPPSPP